MEETTKLQRKIWKQYYIGESHIDIEERTWTKKTTVKTKLIGQAMFRYIDEELTKIEKIDNQEKYEYIKTVQKTYIIYKDQQQQTKHQQITTRKRTVLYQNTVSTNQ